MYVFLEPFFDYLIPANDLIVIRSIVQNLLTLGFLYYYFFRYASFLFMCACNIHTEHHHHQVFHNIMFLSVPCLCLYHAVMGGDKHFVPHTNDATVYMV
jgi:hypothetical protein